MSSDLHTLSIYILDVGQGDTIAVRFPSGKVMLVDGNASNRLDIVNWLRLRLRRLDWVVATHAHSDHIDGLLAVLRALPPRAFWDAGFDHPSPVYRAVLRYLVDHPEIDVVYPKAGDRLVEGGVVVDVLAPMEPHLTGTNSDVNNSSIVLRLTHGYVSVVLGADAEVESWHRLLDTGPTRDLRGHLLKVSHHGSNNGTRPEVVERIQPLHAVISVGEANDYGHPHQETLILLSYSTRRFYRTDQQGTLEFHSDGYGYRIGNRRLGWVRVALHAS